MVPQQQDLLRLRQGEHGTGQGIPVGMRLLRRHSRPERERSPQPAETCATRGRRGYDATRRHSAGWREPKHVIPPPTKLLRMKGEPSREQRSTPRSNWLCNHRYTFGIPVYQHSKDLLSCCEQSLVSWFNRGMTQLLASWCGNGGRSLIPMECVIERKPQETAGKRLKGPPPRDAQRRR